MSLRESDAYLIRDVEGALRYASGRAEHTPGTWIFTRTGEDGAIRCAWRKQEDHHELALSRKDALPTDGDLYRIRKALWLARLEESEPAQVIDSRNTVILKLHSPQTEALL